MCIRDSQNRDTEANERAVVAISVDGKQTWTELYDLEENAAVDWKVHTASLEAYQGQKIHLAFNYEDPSVGGAFGFFIDNIVLSQAMVTSTEDDLSTKVSLKVFPNPSTNQLFIDLDYDREQTTHLQLFDVTGRRLIDKIVNHHQLIQEDISALSEGMYWLRLTSGAYQRTVKVVKY